MQLNISLFCRAALLVTLMTATAAAVTIHPLVGDAAAIPGWTGTQSFSGDNASHTHTVTATVDYAVYAPGQFYASVPLGLPPGAADPSGGSEYVYAYELFTDSLSDQVSSALTVGLDPGTVSALSTFVNHYSYAPELGLAPALKQFIHASGVTTNAKWTFPNPLVVQGQHSDIVLFTSPFGPHFHGSSVSGGSSTVAGALLPSPTPAPEPGTLALAACAVVCLLSSRRLRRRVALK